MNRLRELDFLRGIAIILVLLRHKPIFPFTETMGWIGVDLFFVLSGFLVSGLLFKEYLKYGDIQAGRFLIRRGFKIYPIYYGTYPIYIIPILLAGTFQLKPFLSDMFFYQNYYWDYGYAYAASWSLAVEEHFYFLLALLITAAIKYNWVKLKETNDKKLGRVEFFLFGIMLTCLCLRIISNLLYPDMKVKNFEMSHLRIDSLITGVLISYLYYFKPALIKQFFDKNERWLWLAFVLCLSFTPFVDVIPSFFEKTFGFTFIYIGFGILLTAFLLKQNINTILNKLLSKHIANGISKIGVYSYSIYIIHSFINAYISPYLYGAGIYVLRKYVNKPLADYLDRNMLISFLISASLSILAGYLMTTFIESFFLSLRDKFFPSRAALAKKLA